jgi:hypothetical protein
MVRRAFALALLLLAACNGEKKNDSDSIYLLNRDPVSVRGWIFDVAGAKHAEIVEIEIARRQGIFMATSLWVESSQYASGGIANNGAVVILDVPPMNATIGFNAPGAENAKLHLQNVPGNADVFIPDIILERGGAKVLDPKKILVRVPAAISKAKPTGKFAMIGGYNVPIVATPIGQFTDRREYPNPGGFRPVATVK